MRGLACVLLVVAGTTAAAHPASGPGIPPLGSPRQAPRPPPRNVDDLAMPNFEAPDPCASGKTWNRVTACLKKQGDAKLVYDTPTVKVVQIPFGGTSVATRLWLFVHKEDGSWYRGQFTGFTNATTELLGIAPFTGEAGAGLRLDFGTTAKTTFAIDPVTVTRGILRRVNTTVCVPTAWSCRSVTSACEAYVHGRLLWSFHSEIVWKTAIGLRLHTDASQAGGTCTPARGMIEEAE